MEEARRTAKRCVAHLATATVPSDCPWTYVARVVRGHVAELQEACAARDGAPCSAALDTTVAACGMVRLWCEERFLLYHYSHVPLGLRELHTDAVLTACCAAVLVAVNGIARDRAFWLTRIRDLDLALIVSAAPGDIRRSDVHACMSVLQGVLTEGDAGGGATKRKRSDGAVPSPTSPPPGARPAPVLYLAQHTLLVQFPWLAQDMSVPDYVYSSPPMPWYAGAADGRPAEPICSVWMGPKGTLSPAHTDPYYNCYVQVVGTKRVWTAPPNAMEGGAGEERDGLAALMPNTSDMDVFGEAGSARMQPRAMEAELHQGDLLFLPPLWWHSMWSTDKSFSVSFWF
ncbi:[histone H3]-dimethyl-L-lysine(36) demethylase [Malassezia sp. CBS 17886]|nr:[histone H3]-dimethyl-L-lysine(36) demethylase [Malassezia sp. CBS 17886]